MRAPAVTSAPKPALVVASVLSRDLSSTNAAIQAVAEKVGGLSYVSEALPFPWTSYYSGELGESPVRRIIALGRDGDSAGLATLKRTTCRLEVALGRPGAPREVNIDPGVLNEHQLVVASTKPRAHRIHVGQGIFADLMLVARGGGGLAPLPWTYPDYADDTVRTIFDGLRALLLAGRRLDPDHAPDDRASAEEAR